MNTKQFIKKPVNPPVKAEPTIMKKEAFTLNTTKPQTGGAPSTPILKYKSNLKVLSPQIKTEKRIPLSVTSPAFEKAKPVFKSARTLDF